MDRRQFLQRTLVSAGALVVGVRCGSEAGQGLGATALPIKPGEAYFPLSVASGDPRAASVILWTRAVDPAAPDADVKLRLEVATDETFAKPLTLGGQPYLALTAKAAADHCLKVKVEGLSPATTYYYRFVVEGADALHASRTGRTRTAPAADADVAVRFAVVSCQDYNGTSYNTLRRLAEQPIDFFVHLGDYIYETTGDPSFQATGGRVVTFRAPQEAIAFHAGTDKAYYAAKSLGNYRDLYRTYRSDADLQRLHERAPMIATWDDHEFSDDCFGDTATYFDGVEDEKNPARRAAADQAWFEYMPIDDPVPGGLDAAGKFPDNFRIWRDFAFGKHVHLLMTDLRRYRSDHLVPEDAFPGAVFLDEAAIAALGEPVPDLASSVLDLAVHDGGSVVKALQPHLAALGWPATALQGKVSALWINSQIAKLNKTLAADKQIAAIADDAIAKAPRGLAWHHLGKNGLHSSIGSRYLVVESVFRLLAKARWQQTQGASETALGEAQEGWFLTTLAASKATWKVWGNSFCLLPKVADLSLLGSLPPAFKQRFLLSAEDWDGQPNRRDLMLKAAAATSGVVAITGDIHAFFAATPAVSDDQTKHIVEFVTGAVSSTTYKSMLMKQAGADPDLAEAGAVALAFIAGEVLMGEVEPKPAVKPNPHLAYQALDKHGFLLCEAGAAELVVTMHQIAEAEVKKDLGSGAGLDAAFAVERFRVKAGTSTLEREIAGVWKSFSPG